MSEIQNGGLDQYGTEPSNGRNLERLALKELTKSPRGRLLTWVAIFCDVVSLFQQGRLSSEILSSKDVREPASSLPVESNAAGTPLALLSSMTPATL